MKGCAGFGLLKIHQAVGLTHAGGGSRAGTEYCGGLKSYHMSPELRLRRCVRSFPQPRNIYASWGPPCMADGASTVRPALKPLDVPRTSHYGERSLRPSWHRTLEYRRTFQTICLKLPRELPRNVTHPLPDLAGLTWLSFYRGGAILLSPASRP